MPVRDRGELPEGIDQIAAAVRAADAVLPKIAEHEAVVASRRAELEAAERALAKAKGEHDAALDRLRRLVALGACTLENGCAHDHRPVLPPTVVVPDDPLGMAGVPIVWRVALLLAGNPVLDYQATAERLYGPGLHYLTAKNRVNGHLGQLKTKGVIRTLGSNTYEVDVELLSKLSGIPIPTGAPAVGVTGRSS